MWVEWSRVGKGGSGVEREAGEGRGCVGGEGRGGEGGEGGECVG